MITNQPLNNFARRGLPAMLVVGALLGVAALTAPSATEPPINGAAATNASRGLDLQATKLMQRMNEYLGQAPFFSVSAEVWQDVRLGSGQVVQAGRTVDLQVRRPDRFHAEVRSTRRNRGLFYDGHTITLLDRNQNFYGSIPVPATLDAALDTASERFGIAVPLEDIIVSDSYQGVMGRVLSSVDLGTVTVLGVPCEHLAFGMEKVDWQIWIEQGAQPVPRKILITYKDEEGSPAYTAILSDWDFTTKLPDFVFNFEPPAGTEKISVADIQGKIQSPAIENKAP